MHEEVQSEVLNTSRFDESSDLSMTYLGRTDMTRANKIESEEKFAIRRRIYGSKIFRIVRWYGILNTLRHRSWKIIYVKVILLNMYQNSHLNHIELK